MASIADLIKGLKKLDDQSFRPGDSLIASTINHPVDALSQLGKYLAKQTNTAAGIPEQYDNPYPLLAPSPDAQSQAAFDVAGLAQLGGMPFAPKSAGGTVGTLARPAAASDNLNESLLQKYLQQGSLTPDELAQYERNAVAMRDSNRQYLNVANADAQGGTAMDRAGSMGFDTPTFHASWKGDDISEFGNRIDKTSISNGLGVHSGTLESAQQRGEGTRTFDPVTGKLNPDKSVYYPLIIRQGEKYLDNGSVMNEYDLENMLIREGKKIKADTFDNAGKKAIQSEVFNNYDSVPYINDVEDKGSISYITPPKNIRSRFAAFDPLRKDSADLLATKLLPATMLGWGMYNEKKKRSLADLLGAQ